MPWSAAMPIWHRMASLLQLPARHLLGRASANTKYRDSVAPANYVLAYGRRGAYRTEHHHRGADPAGSDFHFGLGTWIRNQMRHGKMKSLLRWSRTQLPERHHFDDLSWPILVEVWKTLRSSSGC